MIRNVGSIAVLTLGAWLLGGCGGVFESGSGDCEHDGDTYADGESFPAGDGCNTCSCDNGSVVCTRAACGSACFHEGGSYDVGATFPAGDGCNTCSCGEGGLVSCTQIECTSCQDVTASYQTAIDDAKVCDPLASDECSLLITEGLACGCQVFVNPDNASAIAAVQQAQAQYDMLACGGDVACGACAEPTSSYCSAEGRCETRSSTATGAACMVGGIVYESGTDGIDDPFSCNSCQCVDGQLGCTEIACPEDCPPDSVPGTQCAQCGPTDDCDVVEHACLPVCTDSCNEGECIEGVCRQICA